MFSIQNAILLQEQVVGDLTNFVQSEEALFHPLGKIVGLIVGSIAMLRSDFSLASRSIDLTMRCSNTTSEIAGFFKIDDVVMDNLTFMLKSCYLLMTSNDLGNFDLTIQRIRKLAATSSGVVKKCIQLILITFLTLQSQTHEAESVIQYSFECF